MLILTRREEETVIVGGAIVFTVLDIRPSSVKIGVEAPEGVPIIRGELANSRPVTKDDACDIGLIADRAAFRNTLNTFVKDCDYLELEAMITTLSDALRIARDRSDRYTALDQSLYRKMQEENNVDILE